MSLPQRTDTHRIDTLATRILLQDMPPDWVVRSLEERDYGVDLQIEVFDEDRPTGRIAHIQVKGTKAPFDGAPSLSFPVKTIEYAKLFSAPFFVFHTSLASQQTYFVWLQNYADLKLPKDSPNWKTQGSATLYFPRVNLLKESLGKIEQILIRHELRRDAFAYLAHYEILHEAIESMYGNHHAMEMLAHEAITQLDRLSDAFFEQYAAAAADLDLSKLREELVRMDPSSGTNALDEQMDLLKSIKSLVLHQKAIDLFALEEGGEDAAPY